MLHRDEKINVLIALIDPLHAQHGLAHDWLARSATPAWATCPMTENGVLRIVGDACYANATGSPAACVPALASLLAFPGHQFWPDDISQPGAAHKDNARLLHSGQTTGMYLLALAVAQGARLASFDRRLVTDAVRGGAAAWHLIC